MKKVIKVTAPVYTVDLSNVETVGDIYVAFVEAKVIAGEAIRPYELYMYIGSYQNDVIAPVLDDACSAVRSFNTINDLLAEAVCTFVEKKNTPWYKKIWRKVTGFFHGK